MAVRSSLKASTRSNGWDCLHPRVEASLRTAPHSPAHPLPTHTLRGPGSNPTSNRKKEKKKKRQRFLWPVYARWPRTLLARKTSRGWRSRIRMWTVATGNESPCADSVGGSLTSDAKRRRQSRKHSPADGVPDAAAGTSESGAAAADRADEGPAQDAVDVRRPRPPHTSMVPCQAGPPGDGSA